MSVSFEIKENNVQQVLDESDEVMGIILEMIGIDATDYASHLCPVDTGNLRSSIDYEVDDNTVIIGAGTDYAAYVELGTGPYYVPPPGWMQNNAPKGKGIGHSFVHSRPYLRPAIENHLDRYRHIIENELQQH